MSLLLRRGARRPAGKQSGGGASTLGAPPPHGTHTIKWGAYFEHSGQIDFIQGTTAGPGQTVNQNGDFSFNDTGNPNTTGLAVANAHPRQFRYLCRVRRYHGLPDGLSPTQWKVFQPRLGLAYAFAPTTALRAGFGSFANRTAINRDTALGGNPPFQLQETVVNGLVVTGKSSDHRPDAVGAKVYLLVTRRNFVQSGAVAAAAGSAQPTAPSGVPWYRRVCRWGQTNITERDPVRYDIPFWRDYWKRTRIQGVIINAGGIVAYYPSKFPLHHRAEFLNGRDLYGELAQAAHQDGLAVLARMDCNRTAEDFYRVHPDWFARQASGEPHRAEDKYVTCVNSPYYHEYIPDVLREIVERSHPEGFADNSWSGLGRESICYCDNCASKFRASTGRAIPARKDWTDTGYRQWIQWNYQRRLEILDLFNRTTKDAGGPNCLYIGMNSGSVSGQSRSFRDLAEIAKRSEFMLLDHQARADESGFQQNGDTGKLIHGLLGWDKLAPESMALYQAGRPTFRLAAKPPDESRMWMIEGIAGGIQPWWHHIGAWHEDRRAYRTAEPVFRWHEEHERYLINRQPVASIGVVWSQRNTDYYGRDESAELVDAPFRGVTEALLRARLPYLPVHADHIDRDASRFSALVLPSVGALSDAQCSAVKRFVANGGGLVATGATSLYDEWGDARPDFALAELFGAHAPSPDFGRKGATRASAHTYLRLPAGGERHPVLRGFEETEILPFGGALEALRTDAGVSIPLTFIPAFPIYPPETSWMRVPKTDIPGLVLSSHGDARVAYLPADIDRRFGRDNLPDHGKLLANIFRWVAADRIPLDVRGPGLIDCHLYRQPGRLILHLVNLTNEGTWRAPLDELIAVGPLEVRVKLPDDVKGRGAQYLVSKSKAGIAVRQGWATLEVKSVLDHEVVVIS